MLGLRVTRNPSNDPPSLSSTLLRSSSVAGLRPAAFPGSARGSKLSMDDMAAALAERDAALAEVAAREADLDKIDKSSPIIGAKVALVVAAAERVRHARNALAALQLPAAPRAPAAGDHGRERSASGDSSESSSGGSEATFTFIFMEDRLATGVMDCYLCSGDIFDAKDDNGDDFHDCHCGDIGKKCDCGVYCRDCEGYYCSCRSCPVAWYNE